MFIRHALEGLKEALRDTPVVLLHGARQTGKSTLAQLVASHPRPAARYLTLDDPVTMAAALEDPGEFLSAIPGRLILDEVQRAPGLFLAIKREVDRDRRPGRYLLTGSANVLLLPKLSESLAGRMEILTLWPLSQGEIGGLHEGFVDALFSRTLALPLVQRSGASLIERVLQGGYPEVVSRSDPARRRAWFDAYVATILQRDVRDLSRVEGLVEFPRLLALLAARAGTILSMAEISRSSGIPQTTLRRYFSLLETAFLVRLVPAWSGNIGRRLVKAPRLFLCDTGLAAALLGADTARMRNDPTLRGRLLENFVVMELTKQISWSRSRPRLLYFRTASGHEVDVVLEGPAGDIVGIEIKAASTVGTGDFRGLRALADATGPRFRRGVVLYTGETSAPMGSNLLALPVHTLWTAWAGRQHGPRSRRAAR